MAHLRRTWTVAALVAAALGITLSLAFGGAFGTAAATGAAPQAAAAATTTAGQSAAAIFGCRASVARVTLAGQNIAEPAVANDTSNAATMCNTDTAAVAATSLTGNSSALGNLGTVGPAGAYTYETGNLGGATSPGVTSIADVQALSLNLGGYTITAAGPLESQAAVECVGTAIQDQASSNLTALTITPPGGTPETVDLGSGVAALGSALAPLSALITINANETVSTAGTLIQRLLDITVLGTGAQIVVGEAEVNYPNSAVCAGNVPNPTVTTTVTNVTTTTVPGTVTTVTGTDGTATTVTEPGTISTITGAGGQTTTVDTGTTTVIEPSGSVPGYLQQCATGSVLDPTTGDCVIYYDGQTIFVSKPFQGPGRRHCRQPADGSLGVPLAVPVGCWSRLRVRGAKSYEKDFGTPRSDRILVLGIHDHTEGLAGNDCIDAQGTAQRVTDGNGKDRVYVTSGYNRVVVGNGNNRIYGGNGKDWITDGTGTGHHLQQQAGEPDRRIRQQEAHLRRARKGPLWTNSVVAQIHCGSDKQTLVFARKIPAKYAADHGCKRIVLLH